MIIFAIDKRNEIIKRLKIKGYDYNQDKRNSGPLRI